MKYYYVDSNNGTAGPVSLDQIRLLAGSGQISADPMVAPEGGKEWRPLSTLASIAPVPPPPAGSTPPLPDGAPPADSAPPPVAPVPPPAAPVPPPLAAPPPASPAPPPPTGAAPEKPAAALKINATLLGDAVAGVLGIARKILNPGRIDCWLKVARDYGHYAVLAGAALTLLYALYAAIRTNQFVFFGAGVGAVLALMAGQFAADRFLGAGDKLIAGTPSRLATGAFLECVGLLALLFAAGAFLAGAAACVATRSVMPLVPALVAAALWCVKGGIALHPRMVGVEQEGGGSAGEEAVGLLLFFLKAGLKIVPLAFALLAVAGCVVTLLAFSMNGGPAGQGSFSSGPRLAGLPGMEGPALLLGACLVPLAAYCMFLLASLTLDVIRAILALPGKLDSLRK